MNKDEFKLLRKELKLTQPMLAQLLKISPRTVQEYEYGNLKIPFAVSEVLKRKVDDDSKNNVNDGEVYLNANGREKISIQELATFFIKHKDKFLELPEIKLMVEYERKDAKAELLEKHIILRNQQNLNKT